VYARSLNLSVTYLVKRSSCNVSYPGKKADCSLGMWRDSAGYICL
jgi:hypothetical protein